MRTALSEWTKLRTTASLWWTTALFIVFGVGFIGVFAVLTKKNQEADVPADTASTSSPPPSKPPRIVPTLPLSNGWSMRYSQRY